MSVLNEKKITIHLPRITWKSLLTLRAGLVFTLLTAMALFIYWFQAIRPFLWISSAHVNAFSSQISAERSGKIIEMGPEEGEMIHKGAPLFILDNDSILATQKQIQASIHSLNQQVQVEKARMEKAMQDYLSASTELDMGIGSQEMVNRHLSTLEEAQIKSEEATLQINQFNRELSDLDEQIKEMKFSAPFDAIVLKKSKNPGELISQGDPIYFLSDPRQIWIEAEIPEKELGQIAIGTPAKVRLPAYPKKEWQGKVAFISPATVSKISSLPFISQNEHVTIKISLEKQEVSLMPGLSAEVGLKVH
ncbi:MAG TPA: efflux RND transporter periplasmic adaptor subunit [Chlamydiales bacterium]|nr:efflux RND transporter periplasmic adaptor subunit [Chlamydiales bacterium]